MTPPDMPMPPSDQETVIPERRSAQARGGTDPTVILDGQYRIERAIGEGAFGRVYLAQDTRIRRNVAIKELRATRSNADGDTYARYLERFEREARAAGMVQHPNIVTVYELGLDADGTYYLVMEYIDGTDLRALLAQVGTLDPQRAVSIALDIARALVDVHEHDIVHRDLKPANIMITRRGTAKLTDFGVAQVSTESERDPTGSKHPGSPAYMSPEQASSTGYIDGRTDLYALGLVLYEMLVGEHFVRRRQPLALARPDVPPRLSAIVERLLARDPDARYQHAADAVRDLELLSADARAIQAPAGVAATPASAPSRRRRGIAFGLTALLIGAAAIIAGWLAFHGPSATGPAQPTLVPGRPTWFAPNGALRLQYLQGWTTKTDSSDPTSLIEIDGPDGLIIYVNATTPQPAETLDQAIARYRKAETNDPQLAFTDRAELDATVGGESAKMVTVTVRTRGGETPPHVWEYWIVNHGGKEYRFLATDVGAHGTDVAAIVASIAFLA